MGAGLELPARAVDLQAVDPPANGPTVAAAHRSESDGRVSGGDAGGPRVLVAVERRDDAEAGGAGAVGTQSCQVGARERGRVGALPIQPFGVGRGQDHVAVAVPVADLRRLAAGREPLELARAIGAGGQAREPADLERYRADVHGSR